MVALVGYVVFVAADAYWPVVIALVCHGIGQGHAAAGTVVGRLARRRRPQQGAAAGLMTATGPVGHVLSPFIIMPLYEVFHEGPYIMNGVLMALLLVYIVTSPRIRANLRWCAPTR